MTLKVFQLNMWAGTHFPAIQEFLEKNDFDILCFQEVTGPNTFSGNVRSTENQFEKLQQLLGPSYRGECEITTRFTSDPVNSFAANAIFYRNTFSLDAKNIFWLNKRDTPFPSDAKSFEGVGRNVIDLTLSRNNKSFHVLCAHLAWARTSIEQSFQRQQNFKLLEYMKAIPNPWILTGDFNIQPDQPSILGLEKLGKDLTKENGIQNTLDPTYHHAWEEIKPGFAVDYIFVTPDIKVIDFRALDTIHLSDHFGLSAILEE